MQSDGERWDRVRRIRSLALARGDMNLVRECDMVLPPAQAIEECVPEVRERAVPVRRKRG